MEVDVEEELRERQENEVEALKAIFDTSFTDLRCGDAWRVWRPAEFSLLLRPEHNTRGAPAHVTAEITVKADIAVMLIKLSRASHNPLQLASIYSSAVQLPLSA